jgi:hypothetical protein
LRPVLRVFLVNFEVQLEALAERHPPLVVHLVQLLPLSHELSTLQKLTAQVLLGHLDFLTDGFQESLKQSQVFCDVLFFGGQLSQLRLLLADSFIEIKVRGGFAVRGLNQTILAQHVSKLRFKLINCGHYLVDQVLLVSDIPLDFTLRNVVRPLVLVLLDLDPFDLLPRLFGLLLLFDGLNLDLVDDVLSFKP